MTDRRNKNVNANDTNRIDRIADYTNKIRSCDKSRMDSNRMINVPLQADVERTPLRDQLFVENIV